jgi:TldD protein
MDQFIGNIIDSLKTKKVEYGDVRVVEHENETIMLKNGIIEAITRNSSQGFGVRVIKDSAWGFSSSSEIKKSTADKIVNDALSISRASAKVKGQPVVLAPVLPQQGTYETAIQNDPLALPLSEKLDLLIACDKALRIDPKIRLSMAFLNAHKVRVQFASTDGARIVQTMIFCGGGIKAYAFGPDEMQIRTYDDTRQAGFEFIRSLDLVKNSSRVAEESLALLQAKPCPSQQATLILDSTQMVLQVHESCGHPTELDRVLGTEASYAGTSFMTIDKYGKLQYGSKLVNIVADATVPGGLGTFGWDDEGVPAQRIYLIREGRFVGYQSSRETAPVVGGVSSGAMRADGWNRIPLIRMTNINLEPGEWKLEDMIADTRDGVFMTTNKSWSIDDKRLNFQFGCELARRIENGKLKEIYKNPTYADITPRFWNSCDAVGNKDHWRLYGVPNCGKGEPGQTAFVGHGTVPCRFREVPIGIAKG